MWRSLRAHVGPRFRGIVAARDPGSGGAAAVSAHVEVASVPRGTTIPRNRRRGRAGPWQWQRDAVSAHVAGRLGPTWDHDSAESSPRPSGTMAVAAGCG